MLKHLSKVVKKISNGSRGSCLINRLKWCHMMQHHLGFKTEGQTSYTAHIPGHQWTLEEQVHVDCLTSPDLFQRVWTMERNPERRPHRHSINYDSAAYASLTFIRLKSTVDTAMLCVLQVVDRTFPAMPSQGHTNKRCLHPMRAMCST